MGGADNGGDALLREWGQKTFANIPYSRGNIDRFVEKAILEARCGKVIVLLVRVDPSTRWWLKLVAAGAHFAPFFGRVTFEGGRIGGSNTPIALVFLVRPPPPNMDVVKTGHLEAASEAADRPSRLLYND